ncbi:hypothetical protein H8A97_24775 [Bradyrhizobium sp. Arg62]|uniref:hypothetical protein n=1 Tax=Bradyrhizobium brasilense TaxID=1419277 RepID=UPI001E43350E|nr:hypothetical protein [Bradyrhizobium brasilense]MCC8948236.1 hypothetical protein [Bradyrhizobium brasilense]
MRKRIKHTLTPDERLWKCACEASLLTPGPERDGLLEKARQYAAQISMDAWLSPQEYSDGKADLTAARRIEAAV